MVVHLQVAKDQRRGKYFRVEMSGGVASCSCGKPDCVHIQAVRTGNYLTK